MAGRPPEVDTADILRRFTETDEPALFTSEIAADLYDSTQGANTRLKKLEEEGLVNSKVEGRCKVWWITDRGRDHLADELEEDA